jgi:Proteasome-substrate-size regulator, mid region
LVEADLGDWAPTIDPDKLEIKWHVPSDEETAIAIDMYKTAVEYHLAIVDRLIDIEPTKQNEKKSSSDWTDALRQSLKYIVTALLSSTPLYQRIPPAEEWVMHPEEFPLLPPGHEDLMDVDSPDDVEDEAAIEDEGEEEEDDVDDNMGRSQKYNDGLSNRPLTVEQSEMLQSLYKAIGKTLFELASHLWSFRKDDMAAFIELSAVSPPPTLIFRTPC